MGRQDGNKMLKVSNREGDVAPDLFAEAVDDNDNDEDNGEEPDSDSDSDNDDDDIEDDKMHEVVEERDTEENQNNDVVEVNEDDDEDIEEENVEFVGVRRSGRVTKQTERINIETMRGKSYLQVKEEEHNLPFEGEDTEYSNTSAKVMASFVQQYILREGLKVFGRPGYDAAMKEIEQLDKCESFEPVAVDKLSVSEKKKAVEALMFLTEKRDGRIKGRQVYNGKPAREWCILQ